MAGTRRVLMRLEHDLDTEARDKRRHNIALGMEHPQQIGERGKKHGWCEMGRLARQKKLKVYRTPHRRWFAPFRFKHSHFLR